MTGRESTEKIMPCAVAFEIAGQLGLPPSEVGKTADLMILRLMKCQLGLFGYKPESKLVTPKDDPEGSLKEAISAAMVNDRLPCKSAWEIAGQFNVSKMTVSGVCEALKIKVKPCQLGAF